MLSNWLMTNGATPFTNLTVASVPTGAMFEIDYVPNTMLADRQIAYQPGVAVAIETSVAEPEPVLATPEPQEAQA
jgi:hypothetical protein